MMNVALIMERIETWRGGAETSTMQFATHLARQDCRVSVLTTSSTPSTPSFEVVPIKSGWLRAGKTHVFARQAAAFVRKHRFDIVHSITPCPAADVYQPRGGTVPEMLERNCALRPPVQRGLKRLGQKLSLKYRVIAGLERQLLTRQPPPWVIAISDYVRDQLIRHYRFDPARIRQIFNGVDPDLTPPAERREQRRQIRKQFGVADDDLFALCVAHNFKLKGVSRLIEALALLKHRNGHHPDPGYAVVVGRDDPSNYIRLAQRLGVADRIFFSGPTQRIQAFFHAADFLMHPTFYDPCSRVVLEALAAGLPAITTRYNGAAERINNGREGYVVDSPDDVEALAAGMASLADDQHRRECAARAPAAVQTCSMAQHATQVRELYEEILRTR